MSNSRTFDKDNEYKIEEFKEEDEEEEEETSRNSPDDIQKPQQFGNSSRLSIPAIQINNEEFHTFGGRRSSIPASLNNFNIHVYNGRRYSEVILSPTDEFRQDYFKFSNSPLTKINHCLNDVFDNLSKKFRTKNQVVEIHPTETLRPDNEMTEKDSPHHFINPLEDSYEGNEKISYNSNEFLEEDEERGYGDVDQSLNHIEAQPQDKVFVTSESGANSRRNSDEGSKGKQQTKSGEIVLSTSNFGSPVGGGHRGDSGKPLLRRKTSSPITMTNSRRRSLDTNRPFTRAEDFLHRFPSQVDSRTQSKERRYQDNLKSIVLSYFHLTHPKLDHANVNGTKHWDRRSSRVSVHPIMNSLPKDGFGSRMSVITDEAMTNPSSFNETDKESLLKCSELEYSSGGLLTVGNDDHPDSAPTRAPDSETLLFSDGKRRIDLVLVYEEPDHGVLSEVDTLKKERRRVFRENLEKEGLEFELEDKKGSFDEKTYFLKIHAPWQVMTRYAELMNIKMPIREKDGEGRHQAPEERFSTLFDKLFDYDHNKIPDEPSFYKATFTRDKEDQFVVKDRETFFTAAQRSQIVWQILMRAKYDATEKVGIRRLLNDETFLAAFPLHEGRYEADASEGFLFDRRLLYLEWARPARWYKKQPLWLVRKYFGDKIALYFAWLGFYTCMLTLPAIVGVLCFLYGLGSLEKSDNIPGKEICDESGVGNLTLCPMCDKACRYMKLGDSCMYAKITYLFDNPATVFFAIFMSFWATMFLELWKRQQSIIVWEWDLQLVEEDEEPRPEFETSVKTFRINPVTREKEPYLPSWSKAIRFLATGATVLCMIFVVLAAVLGTIIYRISLVAVIYSSGGSYLRDHAKIFTSMTAALINLVIIMILTKFYHQLAIWLTNIENPRTQSEYEDSYTFKIFLFEFVNFYSSLIYIAFFKGRFFMYPGDTDARSSEFLKLKGDVCDPAGCLSELCIQLAIIMIGKQCLNNVLELLYPKFWNWWYHRIHHNNTKKDFKRKLTRWEEDYQMQDAGRLALFEEYLEMVLQYGFVTLFVAAFPLAPLFAFLNNIGEIRLDAYKMVTQSRRPLAERVQNIGAWYGILKGLTYAAVVSNAFVIGYTSDFIPRMVYKFVYSPTHDLTGYIRSSLSEFNTSDYTEDMGSPDDDPDPPICYYRGYRNPPDHPTSPYDLSPQYWHVFAARLAFVVVFEHFVFALTGIMAYVIPDIPAAVKTQMQRERLLAKEAKYERGLKSAGNDEEFLAAIKDQNHSKLESILRRGSWGRRFSKHSNEVDTRMSSPKFRKVSNSSSVEVS